MYLALTMHCSMQYGGFTDKREPVSGVSYGAVTHELGRLSR